MALQLTWVFWKKMLRENGCVLQINTGLCSVRKCLFNWSKLLVKEPGFTAARTSSPPALVRGRYLLCSKPTQCF